MISTAYERALRTKQGIVLIQTHSLIGPSRSRFYKVGAAIGYEAPCIRNSIYVDHHYRCDVYVQCCMTVIL